MVNHLPKDGFQISALQDVWDLGQARFWDRPFKILGTSPLLGHAIKNA